jgi:hypothetical protein
MTNFAAEAVPTLKLVSLLCDVWFDNQRLLVKNVAACFLFHGGEVPGIEWDECI